MATSREYLRSILSVLSQVVQAPDAELSDPDVHDHLKAMDDDAHDLVDLLEEKRTQPGRRRSCSQGPPATGRERPIG